MTSMPKILVVEDEVIIRDAVTGVLHDEGYRIVEAADVDEALALLGADDADFAALVTDVNLSGQRSGWDLASAARERQPTIAVIYMSGHGQAEWPAKGVPGSVLIPKPFALSQLTTAVAGQLNVDRPG
jgi:DNA-binding NtrC family response regulator